MESQTVSQQPEIPLFDLSNPQLKPGSEEWASTCEALRVALEDYGAFLVLYKVDDSIYASSCQLFDLSLEAKMQKTSDRPAHGYVHGGSFSPLFESHALDNPSSFQDCQNFAHILWPSSGNDFFSEAVNAHAKGMVELDQMLKRMVCESYGIDTKKCESFLESIRYAMRFYKYWPTQKNEGEHGVFPHIDSTLFTILHQDSQGLEVQNKHDQWVRVHVSPSLFCVIAGDALSVWSNDRIRPRYHQVMIKTKTCPRYSVGLLSYAGEAMSTAEKLVDEKHPLRYKPFNHYQYLSAMATEKGFRSDYQHRLKEFCGV